MTRPPGAGGPASAADVLLSIVVPVYNQRGSIVPNVREIHSRAARPVPGRAEVIVVSDGSIDDTEAEIYAERADWLRVIHYDRNLGKGYAVKVGSLAARGRWIAYVDADLDLDPAALPAFLAAAEDERLDFAVGSKRHPDSIVEYPASRRAASWLYQQFVRLLIDVDVTDTQVGLKLFRREVVDEVMPLLLTKRYAFDVELLAVARAFGFRRVRELPVRLDYRFTGSGVRSMAVARALVDTVAIFYRLRVLRYYARKRELLGGDARGRPSYRPLVSLVTTRPSIAGRLAYDRVEVLAVPDERDDTRLAAARAATGEVIALVHGRATPATNWIASAVPFLARPDVAAVVVSQVAPMRGEARELAAAAVLESRLGGGSLYFRFLPGNLRFVDDFPETAVVAERADLVAALESSLLTGGSVGGQLRALGGRILYTPETFVVSAPPPLFRPHLRVVAEYGRARARDVERRGLAAVRPSTLGALAVPATAGVALVALRGGRRSRRAAAAGVGLYAAGIAASGLAGGFRFRRPAVVPLAAVGLAATHAVYSAAFLRELLRRGAR